MLHIFLKNRKVLQYNSAENISILNGLVAINDKDGCWIAQIPVDNIERVEALSPFCVLKSSPAPKRANYHG